MGARPHLVFNPTGDLLEAAHECEAAIFTDYYGNTRAELAAEYGPYEETTAFLAVVEPSGRVGATIRLAAPGGARGPKTLDDIARDPWRVDGAVAAQLAGLDVTRTWDISTIGVRRDAGQGRQQYASALYRGIVLVREANGLDTYTAILDRFALRLQAVVGYENHPLPGTFTGPYLGSPASTPVYAHLGASLERQAALFPRFYRGITLGCDITEVDIPPVEHFVLPSRAAQPAA